MSEKTGKSRGAVIVTRVSTGEQVKHGTSLADQRAACRAKAAALGLPVVAEYEDAGVSGSFLALRVGMTSAIADIRAGRADTLITASISRYSRDVEHQQAIRKGIQAAGGRVVFCDMDFDDTPEGDMAFGVFGTFAEYERKNIRSRGMKGKRRKAMEGVQTTRSSHPYGYRIPTKADILRGTFPAEQLGRYVVQEAEAAVMTGLFEKYASGSHSLPMLARELNAAGLPAPRGGQCWRAPTIQNMFRNPVYKGQPVFGRWEHFQDEGRLGEVNQWTGKPISSPQRRRPLPGETWIPLSAPAIVDEETWDGVQRRLAENRSRMGGNPKRVRMLSGRVVCPGCGASMRVKYIRHVDTYYYTCHNNDVARRDKGERFCTGAIFQIAQTEDAVIASLLDACRRPEALEEACAVYRSRAETPEAGDEARRELAGLDAALAELAQEEEEAVRAQIAGIRAGASPDAYKSVFAQIAARRTDLEVPRKSLAHRLAPPDPARGKAGHGGARPASPEEVAVEALENARRVLTSPHVTGEEKRDAIGHLIEKVICRKGGADVVYLPAVFRHDTLQRTSADRSG